MVMVMGRSRKLLQQQRQSVVNPAAFRGELGGCSTLGCCLRAHLTAESRKVRLLKGLFQSLHKGDSVGECASK